MEIVTQQVYEDALPKGLGTSPGAYILEHAESGQFYIGSSGELGARKRTHLSDLRRGVNCNQKLQQAYDEDPQVKFTFILTETASLALDYEQKLLDLHRGDPNLMNVATNARAPGAGLTRSPETRQLISDAGKGRAPWNKGEKMNPAYYEAFMVSRERVSKKVSIEGVVYASSIEASRQLNCAKSTVHKRIMSQTERFSNYKFVD